MNSGIDCCILGKFPSPHSSHPTHKSVLHKHNILLLLWEVGWTILEVTSSVSSSHTLFCVTFGKPSICQCITVANGKAESWDGSHMVMKLKKQGLPDEETSLVKVGIVDAYRCSSALRISLPSYIFAILL